MIVGVLTKPIRFLTLQEVLSLHAASIEQFGGSSGIRDQGLLESALAQPQTGFGGEFSHAIPFAMAAAYAFHISKNHPFIDGNKRTAFGACIAFLRLNGWDFGASDDTAADQLLALVEGTLDKSQFGDWLAGICKARSSCELREFFSELSYEHLYHVFAGLSAGSSEERLATINEAAAVIPAVHQANLGALSAAESGDSRSADVLQDHCLLLTAIFRLSEDRGYEW